MAGLQITETEIPSLYLPSILAQGFYFQDCLINQDVLQQSQQQKAREGKEAGDGGKAHFPIKSAPFKEPYVR